MPLYEYEHKGHGIRVTLHLPVEGRPSRIVLKRRTVPSRVTVGVGAQPPTDGQKLAAGYKLLEDHGLLRDRPGYLPVKAVKQAIAEPDTE